MDAATAKKILNKTSQLIAQKMKIAVHPDFNLRTARTLKQGMVQGTNSWTLFINRKGDICQAFHSSGTFMQLSSPEHLHGCFHEEFAMNYFINHVRSISGGFFSVK